MQVRFARQTKRLEAIVAFYRDGLELPELSQFVDHDGYSGVMLGLPGTSTHLEFTATEHDNPPTPHAESLLVLYLGSWANVNRLVGRAKAASVPSANPYWDQMGVTIEDPDGFRVVLVAGSWSDEAEPPSNASANTQHPSSRARPDGSSVAAETDTPDVRIELYEGDRANVRSLFELAEDSQVELDSYLDDGLVLVAIAGSNTVGHLQLIDCADGLEIKNMAVVAAYQRRGIGSRLVRAALDLAATHHRRLLVVATAAADVDNLAFYQRQGFRLRSVERDVFTPDRGYEAEAMVDGIRLRDRVWLDQVVSPR